MGGSGEQQWAQGTGRGVALTQVVDVQVTSEIGVRLRMVVAVDATLCVLHVQLSF